MQVITPTIKQREAASIASTHIVTVFGGAIRGGKTYWLILIIWTWAIQYKRSRWAIVRATNTVLETTTIVTLQTLLDQGLQNDVAKWNRSIGGGTITLHNGSQIIFMAESYDQDKDLNRFRGLEVNGFGVDEINEIQEVTLDKMIERAGSWQHSPGCPIKIVGTCNPTHNWVKSRVYDRYKDNTLPATWAYVPSKITDNVDPKTGKSNLDPAYIESLKDLPVFQYQCFVEGDWDAMPRTGGEFYKLFDHERTVKKVTYDPGSPLHLTFDFNVNPYMTCCIWQIKNQDVLRGPGGAILYTKKIAIQIAEICLRTPNNTTKAICNTFKQMYPGHVAGVFIYGDPSGAAQDTRLEKGHNDYTIIRTELEIYKPGLRVQNVAPSVTMRGNFINTVFNGGVKELEIIIGDSTGPGTNKNENTVNDYLYLKEDSDGAKKKQLVKDPSTGVSYQKYGHTSDANDYFLCAAFVEEYNNYQRGGKALPITLGKNVTKYSY